MVEKTPSTISFNDYLQLSRCIFEWAESYDTKNWERLRLILAPRLKVDYRQVLGESAYWPEISAEDFTLMISAPTLLGNPVVRTQHLIGASWWESVSETEAVGHHQIRAAHVRFRDTNLQEELHRGHGHGSNEHFYEKINGEWKLAGLRPNTHFMEFNFDRVFGEQGEHDGAKGRE
ncbi:Scytalone dehydratase [Aspergillus unguis]